MKKINITFLLDTKNNWILKYLNFNSFRKYKKYNFKIKNDYKSIKNQDIVFPMNYTKILPKKFLQRNNLILVIHSSNLPQDRGFAPVSNQILKGKNTIHFSLIKAEEKVDTGNVCFRSKIRLDGTELYDELRKKQAFEFKKIINKFLKIYPNLKFKKQKGISSFNVKRTPSDSELNVHKSLKSQFNLLRICDNNKFPSFFYLKSQKYILKIFKDKKI